MGKPLTVLRLLNNTKNSAPFVTMDIEMPNLNGIEASKEILKNHKEANIILITSSVDKKEILIALKNGVKQVMQKPITIEEFTKIVNELR